MSAYCFGATWLLRTSPCRLIVRWLACRFFETAHPPPTIILLSSPLHIGTGVGLLTENFIVIYGWAENNGSHSQNAPFFNTTPTKIFKLKRIMVPVVEGKSPKCNKVLNLKTFSP